MNEKRINKEIKTLKKQRDEAELGLTALQSQFDRLQEQFDVELEKRVAPLRKEIAQLLEGEKATEAICNNAAQHAFEQKKRIEDLEMALAEKTEQGHRLFEEKAKEIAGLQYTILKLQEENTSLKAEDVRALRKRLQKKSEEIDTLKTEIENLKRSAGRPTNEDRLKGAMRQNDLRSYVLPMGLGPRR